MNLVQHGRDLLTGCYVLLLVEIPESKRGAKSTTS